LYRQNAKKTNDVNVQFEFCAFVMEVVAELEQATAMEKMAQQVNVAGGGGGGGTEQIGGEQLTEVQKESKRKQKALVTESITLLNKLAQRGHVKSQYFLADCYTQGVGTLKVSFFSLFLDERDRSRNEAMLIATFFLLCQGKRDYDKAFPLFMLAGKHGHVDASFRAAQCLEHGWGCRKDQSKAVSFYR
jgi:TPR repeat protein